MPLPKTGNRTFLNRRTIVSEGYQREDGRLEIEVELIDIRGSESTNPWRGTVHPGNPVHRMSIRVVVDSELVIQETEACTDEAPFPACREAPPNLQRLVGLRITRGFRRAARSRVGGPEGCTHLFAALEVMAATAMQTAAAALRGERGREFFSPVSGTDRSRPGLIDSCKGYAADGPVVQRYWPVHFRPRS
jgi:Protein of unknown function (DUF2889)